MRRELGFVALAVLALALGVGSSAAVFGMVDQLLLRALPGTRDGDGAAYLQFRSVQDPNNTQGKRITTLDFDELRRSADLLSGIASFGSVPLKVSVGDSRPILVYGEVVYGDFFETLRASPAAGRLLAASETSLDADPLRATVSEALARRLFGSVEAAPGRSLRMNDQTVLVTGVAGGGFAGVEQGFPSDVWLPYGALVPLLGFEREGLSARNSVNHGDIIIRTGRGIGAEAVVAQVDGILSRLAQAGNGSGPYLSELRTFVFPGLHVLPAVRSATYESLRLLAIVVGLVLVLACGNVANLLLFRNVRTRGSVATQRALGASTTNIARQQLAASLILGSLGVVAGIIVGWVILLPFRGLRLLRMPAFEGLVLDVRVLLFGVAACLITTLLFGTLPALLAGRFDLAGALHSSNGRDTGRMAAVRSALSAGQLALSMVLLVGALLLVRSMQNLNSVDRGIHPEGVYAVTLDLPPGAVPEERELQVQRLLEAVRTVPEVRNTASDSHHPFGPRSVGRVRVAGDPDGAFSRPFIRTVTPAWFELLGVRAIAGRTFRDAERTAGRGDEVVLTESLATRLFGTAEATGRVVEAGFAEVRPMEVIGVVSDIRSATSPDRPEDTFFVLQGSMYSSRGDFTLLLAVQPFNAEVSQRIRTALEAQLPDEPIPDVEPLSDRLDLINGQARIYSRLLTLLAAIAVVLSTIGLYGVVASTVAARQREFGVRVAFGADASRILGLVTQNVTMIVGSGTIFGLAGALLLSDLLEERLFGVTPTDPTSYVAAAAAFVVVAVMASWAPTRRAIGADPVDTLRAR